jgi:hypothetical protein
VSDTTTDFFDNIGSGVGAPSAHLKNVGDYVHGEVVEMFKRDYIPFGKTEPEKDESEADGKRKQLVIILQTDFRNWQGVVSVPKIDPSDPNSGFKGPEEDDGKRAVYVPNRSNVQWAIGRAVAAAKAKFEVGVTLGFKIENLRDTGKGNPLKEHAAVYQGKPASAGFFGGQEQAQQPAQQAPSAPAAQAPAAAPAPAPAPQQDPWTGQQAAAPAPQAAPQAPAPQQDPWANSGSAAPAPSAPPF